jgi:hypothetical protein
MPTYCAISFPLLIFEAASASVESTVVNNAAPTVWSNNETIRLLVKALRMVQVLKSYVLISEVTKIGVMKPGQIHKRRTVLDSRGMMWKTILPYIMFS